MHNTIANATTTARTLGAFLVRGGLVRVGRCELYAGSGSMLPDQFPMVPRWDRAGRSLVVRVGAVPWSPHWSSAGLDEGGDTSMLNLGVRAR